MHSGFFGFEGILFLLRWLHLFFGVTWIGILYYFNFIQGAFFNETDAATKANAIQKLVPRALWWFRWGAFWTMATGLAYISMRMSQGQPSASTWGVSIFTGAAMGLIMGANVWFVIWPAQKMVIQSTTQVATGGKAIPEAAARGARGAVASRTNTLFSIPMLFFMAGASHLPIGVSDSSNISAYAIIAAVIIIAIEINALNGKTGPMTTIKGVITSGFVLTAVFLIAMLATL